MPTNEERREVARRLKSWKWKSAPPECLLNSLAFGDECPANDDDPETIDCHECECMAAHRLADLIDPRTCRKVPGKMKYGERKPKCSECGYSLGDKRWNFCPKCGCEVMGNAD